MRAEAAMLLGTRRTRCSARFSAQHDSPAPGTGTTCAPPLATWCVALRTVWSEMKQVHSEGASSRMEHVSLGGCGAWYRALRARGLVGGGRTPVARALPQRRAGG